MSQTNIFQRILEAPLTDLPIQVPASRYNEAINLLISRWSALSVSPITIYQIGQVAVPGISDIDFVVVFENGASFDWEEFQPKNFPEWVQQLFTHPPYCCFASSWQLLYGWFPIFNSKLLWGRSLPDPTISEGERSGVALGMLVDYLIVKIPIDILCILTEPPVRLRVLLCLIHSDKYIITLAKEANIPIPEGADQVTTSIDILRGSWFERNPTQRMEDLSYLCETMLNMVGEQITLLDHTLSMIIGKSFNEANITCGNPASFFWFKSPWSFSEAIEIAFKQKIETGNVNWISPYTFTQLLTIYADECPRFAKYLHIHACKTELVWSGDHWDEGLRYHARAMTSC